MSKSVKPIPDGYTSVTPYLIVKGGAAALDFYKKAFGAVVLVNMPMPDGKLGHAEMQIGNARVMLADEFPHMGFRGPQSLGGTSVSLCLYLEDVDSAVPRALAAGAKILKPLQDQFYGDRSATVEDPFGHVWTIATHKEDVSGEEMARRMAQMPQPG